MTIVQSMEDFASLSSNFSRVSFRMFLFGRNDAKRKDRASAELRRCSKTGVESTLNSPKATDVTRDLQLAVCTALHCTALHCSADAVSEMATKMQYSAVAVRSR